MYSSYQVKPSTYRKSYHHCWIYKERKSLALGPRFGQVLDPHVVYYYGRAGDIQFSPCEANYLNKTISSHWDICKQGS